MKYFVFISDLNNELQRFYNLLNNLCYRTSFSVTVCNGYNFKLGGVYAISFEMPGT